MTTLRDFKAGRKKQGCVACGAKPYYQTPWRTWLDGNCKACGASKGKQRHLGGRKSEAVRAEDATLDAMLTKVVEARGAEMTVIAEPISQVIAKPTRNTKASDRLATEAAWQAGHERKMAALRRLGLDDRPEERTPAGARSEIRARDIATAEAKRCPRSELLDAARSGCEYAAWQADGLFENWAKEQRTG